MGLGLPEKVSILIDRFDKKITDLIADDLKLGQENKVIRNTLNVESAAMVLTGALLRTAYYYFVKKKKQKGYNNKDIDKITEEFIDIFLTGIFTPRNNPD
jgi:hypothetical protein